MEFNWRSPLVTRVAILVFTIFAFTVILDGKDTSIFLALALLAAIGFQVSQLVKVVERPTQDVSSFLDAIKFDDLSSSFKTESPDPSVQKLHREMNEALGKLRQSRKEKDSEYQFFKNIVQHVGIGILTFKRDETIQIINNAAKRLLHIDKADRLHDLREVSEDMVEAFLKLKTGGRELVRVKNGDETIQLSIYAIELTLRGEEVKLISMSNIQSELEEKEMEAWQNLVRVLTHEIMNSVTPISSLAGVVEEELHRKLLANELNMEKEEAEDMHLSIQTISRRSEGLIKFVKEFRSLTHIPKPKLAEVCIRPLLDELAMLHKKELADNNITISISVEPDTLCIRADKTLVEQVLINLIKNAIQAFGEKQDRKIMLSSYVNENGGVIVSVKDNGTGIEPEALEKIFIPFFSTKKTGSGIGLSLSKQIMRQHEGNIAVKSVLGEGTEFLLRF
ncbi:MAG: GHKL domain-containing protein [Cytophagales bacterium]|jgi:two-component system nitrogen regulation sensor histidine kinase NtrY|nr:GHKL domain-containing protein [Cytophagales bacterium]MCA6389330.1 GHKL domain-containing protein [Cytophagales bacterium]MCA6392892.1 GHKL domain-containing protein [Cytophagales bacterium]MCA6395459.1 GHKL domain-containing protein [Cytophagales bacterium]MCA6397778.1 GHKL domain-containing protein [Cytophagales bacterium]